MAFPGPFPQTTWEQRPGLPFTKPAPKPRLLEGTVGLELIWNMSQGSLERQ